MRTPPDLSPPPSASCPNPTIPETAAVAPLLLAWYDRHHRSFPWRISPAEGQQGRRADPYHVWLSEVMLQQTTVQAVIPYFQRFLALWPRVEDLAEAETDAVMKAWAGLGYYARARNLKKCAEAVARDHAGRFPDTEDGLRALPGVGDYTAAAVAAIAFDRPSAVVDGNVERVVSRLFLVEDSLPAAKRLFRALTASITPQQRPGDFAQAMMDLGSTICTPRRPVCALCPLNDHCLAFRSGAAVESYPRKAAKKDKPVRKGAAFVARDQAGAIFLRKRAESGLLGGMSEVPNSAWTSRVDGETGLSAAPFSADWQACGTVTHVFTHFELQLSVYSARDLAALRRNDGWWEPAASLSGAALPTVMKKAIALAFPDALSP
ncbi:A/G-specific adenine glycosylase [Xaviernesmea oryzae]|uniref:Adenine DNA glycosylase n=1 Tax=Xaviernesmea oryzae TaxID=464029 RepID=A0A1Q9ATX8_9HYPH|nr:A/G-specific adenine glycosylase [Xaviernesmea oryzae]OLP58791.1 A/G-specific adenine glycosylase [Xaviernesmea oryzae]SEK64674.1 A/G-specific DNA-adenine glycosylase [Xaviernesmea oryzae]